MLESGRIQAAPVRQKNPQPCPQKIESRRRSLRNHPQSPHPGRLPQSRQNHHPGHGYRPQSLVHQLP
ncbi:uncharacterized protein BKA78DRAFT_188692 [Phyllosticta capitalensis]|uniref:uncharacterized protein n=1 Tax=Phyllosticta capitalensis TaxID=121624 RepID=UPI00312EECD1